MRNRFVKITCLLSLVAGFFLLSTTESFAAEKVVLKNSAGELSIESSGAMSFVPSSSDCPAWNVKAGEAWKITLAKGTSSFKLSDPVSFTPGNQNKPTFKKIDDGVEFSYNSLSNGGQSWKVGLTLQVLQKGEDFQFVAKVDNQADACCVKNLKFPILFNIHKQGSDHKDITALLPTVLGERTTQAKLGKSRRLTYPSGQSCSMQYFVLDAGKAGLYLACHDEKRKRKSFNIANMKTGYNYSLENEPYCMTGKSWKSAPAVVMPYNGTWHTASRHYRAWVDTWMEWAPTPDWVRNQNNGWFLCILKQQNGDLMFPYDKLDEVADIADEWGLDVLGLFGWAHGGHDRLYPDNYPDPKMGGPEVLKKAIKRVQKRGKKVILYANGQLIDTASNFYKKHGADCTSRQPDGKPYSDRYNKFKSTPDPTFARGCFGSEIWYQRMFKLGSEAQDLGADGFIYDQFGIGGPGFCFNEEHGHDNPIQAWAEDRFRLTQRLTDALRARKPGFVVMTEWVIDGLAGDFPYFHGCGNSLRNFIPSPGQKLFPELFRYTYPELIVTQRNANPMSTRNIANLACFYNFRHENESRYTADVKYLKHDMPVPADYSDCNSPPNVKLVCATPPKPAAKYMREVIALRNQFAEFLKVGRFVDVEGISFEGSNCVANGYLAEDGRLGVVVWNYSDKPESVKLSAAGRKLLGEYVPGESKAAKAGGEVAAESVRFYLWSAK